MPKGTFKNPKERARKISESKKMGAHFTCWLCDKEFWRKPYDIKKGNNKFCCKEHYLVWQKGKKRTDSFREKCRQGQKKRHKGRKLITPINKRIRASDKYKIWRLGVFERDKYTCQECGACGVYLHAHHKKPFAIYPKLRFDIKNGETLCKKCHAKKPKEHNFRDQEKPYNTIMR